MVGGGHAHKSLQYHPPSRGFIIYSIYGTKARKISLATIGLKHVHTAQFINNFTVQVCTLRNRMCFTDLQ